ncbi:UDP-glucose dehydrogenase family protein [Neobacillus sp. LXY-4]|uniref:UDP-glucose dehydrogenase family protein n=1 Tax=Neobacillus sp. LXY-4 TaxID=3379826 RepID=UPI003EDEF1E3
MRKISVVGMGYVGLVTAVSLSSIGHDVTCIEMDKEKLALLQKGISPIYEPGLEIMLQEAINNRRLRFTFEAKEGLEEAEIIYIAVGTPTLENGSVNLDYLEMVINEIAACITKNVIVVVKSTVPVGTNHMIKAKLDQALPLHIKAEVISNPEFLREGSAIYDTFHADRIVIGADNQQAADVMSEVNKPFGVPIFHTDILSAEMIKYASNAFLATKISFINEMANICEKVGADIESVSVGMGMDQRIGPHFLKAGIGYGGSCFPKDTKALSYIAADVDYDFHLLKAVIDVNNKQQRILLKKARERFQSLNGKKVALLGLAFKPNTDDMRESPSLVMAAELVNEGAEVVAFDPVAGEKASRIFPTVINVVETLEIAIKGADMAFILTDWEEFKGTELSVFVKQMKQPIIFDGRNCFKLTEVEKYPIEYHSIGRKALLI